MMTTTTTPSPQTGPERTDIEVVFSSTKAFIAGITVQGKNWIIQNMNSNLQSYITVDKEFYEEVKRYIQGSGLSISERN